MIERNSGLSVREEMEYFLDYEIRSAFAKPLWPWLEMLGFNPLLGWWYGRKVNRKYARYLKRASVMDAIIKERGPYFGFRE